MATKGQLVIPEPNALIAFDTQRIMVAPGGGEAPPVEVAQWRDNIPKLIQAKLIESFENANYLAAVARPIEGLAADYQPPIDVRDFEIFCGDGTQFGRGRSRRVRGEDSARKR